MKVKENTAKSARLLRSPWALALACAVGMQISTSAAKAQVLIDSDVDRPAEELMVGQTVYTQPEGATQMILSGSQDRDGDLRQSHVSARAEFGVTDRLQVQAEVPFDITDRSTNFAAQSGISRIAAGAKYLVTAPRSPIALAAGMDVEVPLAKATDVTGDRPAAGPTYKPSLILAAGAGPVTVHTSAQAELGQPSRALNASIGSQYALGNWVPSFELNSKAVENTNPQFYATPGLTYKISDRAQLGVGAAVGLNDQSSPVNLMAKFSMQLGR